MKSVYKAALLVVGLSISALATDTIPVDTHGGFTFPNYAGAKTCTINVATGTTAAECFTGAGVILQIINADFVSSTESIVLRDSNTANVTSSTLSVHSQASLAGTYIYPRVVNGLSVNALSNPTGNDTWTIIYTTTLK